MRWDRYKEVYSPLGDRMGNWRDFAARVVEDLREAIAEYGKQPLSEIHLFPSGMIAYPFVLGALLGNWCPVIVYHLQGNQYVPLYRLTKEWLQAKRRTTRALSRFEIQTLNASVQGERHGG